MSDKPFWYDMQASLGAAKGWHDKIAADKTINANDLLDLGATIVRLATLRLTASGSLSTAAHARQPPSAGQ